jgi:RimJ/RimL family protein N-acetyltransferase/acyl carrier protein
MADAVSGNTSLINAVSLDINQLSERFTTIVPGTGFDWSILSIYAEPLTMDGLEEMHRYSSNPLFYEFLEFEPFYEIEQTRQYIEKLQKRMSGEGAERTANYWFIRRKSDDLLIGTAALVDLDYARQSISWGYGVDPSFWGEGYILQIQDILKHFVFEVLGLNRLWGRTMVTNHRTIASLKATGMVNEGVLRQFYCKSGKFIDSWEYSMLRSEYTGAVSAGSSNKESGKVVTSDIGEQDVVDLIAKVITEEHVDIDSGMNNLMTWDSLNHMSIMLALNDTFGVKLGPAEITRATSVKSILEILQTRF